MEAFLMSYDEVPDEIKAQMILVSLKIQKCDNLKDMRGLFVSMIELIDKVEALNKARMQ